MTNIVKNPWEMGQEEKKMPDFTVAKYMVLRLNPPKRTGNVRDGIVSTLGMMSYQDENNQEVTTIEVSTAPNGYSVNFPLGKKGVMATKYRGPKFPSVYRFVNALTNKWYTLDKELFTPEYAEKYLAENIKGWDQFSETDKQDQIDEYFENMYMFALAKDFNLNVEENETLHPHVGMVTNFYRKYIPPKEDERFGNIIATKFAPKEGRENLTADFKTVDEAIAEAIYEAIVTKTQPETDTFNPSEFDEPATEEEDSII